MTDFDVVHLTEFKAHFKTQFVRLPLKYPLVELSKAVNDQFTQQISTNGEIVDLSNRNSFLDSVIIDVLNDLKTITLTPIMFKNPLSLELQNVQVQLPHKLIAHNCFAVNVVDIDEDLNLVLDFIDHEYLFITVIVNIKDFIPYQGNDFELSQFRNWGNVSVPYSFELRSKPFLFTSLDGLNFLVSLNDGAMLHFKRQAYLIDFDIYNFNDQSKGLGLFGFFKETKPINDNCIVDSIVFDGTLITLTVNKVLKFWDLSNHELKTSISLSDDTYLTPNINAYFKIFNDKLIFHTTNSVEAKIGNTFYILDERGSLSNFTINSPNNQSWYIRDYSISITNKDYELTILWVSNISSIISVYMLDSEYLILQSRRSKLTAESQFMNTHSQEYYKPQIINANYNNLIINTSINILREKLNLPIVKNIDEYLINETVGKLEHDEPWYLLSSIVDEYRKLSQESLGLKLVKSQLIILETNGIGLRRPLNDFEIANGKVYEILEIISNQVSSKSLNKVYEYVTQLSQITPDDLKYILTKFGVEFSDIDNVSLQLNDSIDIIQLLISTKTDVDTFETNLSVINKTYITTAFKDIMEVHKQVLIKLFILLCHLEGTVTQINDIWKKFQNFKIFELVINNNANILVNQPIVQGNIIDKYNYLSETINNEDYLINIILDLVKSNQLLETYDILSKINTGPNKFLVGLIYLSNKDERGFAMVDFNNFVHSNLSYLNHQFTNTNLNTFLSSITKDDESKYYHNLSLFISKEFKLQFVNQAIEYETRAISLSNDQDIKCQYYESLFKMALVSFKLTTVIDALSHLETHPQYFAFFKALILQLVQTKTIKSIFSHKFFSQQYRVVDSILLQCIESTNLLDSIRFYEIVYAWRIQHSDKRKAVEGLYEFVTTFEATNDGLDAATLKLIYLKILEFYIIILNGLKSFSAKDERWLLAGGKIISLKDISGQYQQYLQKLATVN